MASIADLVRSVAGRTHHPHRFVEQRARELQNAGLLPVSTGSSRYAVKARDCSRLLLSLVAQPVREAPQAVRALSDLEHVQDKTRVGDALERLVFAVWQGDRISRGAIITIDTTEPAIAIRHEDGRQERFFETGTILDMAFIDTVRRQMIVPALVIAGIGADLGFRGCADAA